MYFHLFGTKIVETIDTAAAQKTVVTLCRAVLFKAIKQSKNAAKIDSVKLQKQQYTPSLNKWKQKKKKKKKITFYSINILYYSTQQYY